MKMQNVDKGTSAAQHLANKDAAFKKILTKMPPMMRHLFFREHKTPSLWFDMRLNYSKSVATTSIIGHIIGLGDRHVSNILMDEVRGELVAIDLGIAFDQVCCVRCPRWKRVLICLARRASASPFPRISPSASLRTSSTGSDTAAWKVSFVDAPRRRCESSVARPTSS